MLHLCLYHSVDDLYNLDFIKGSNPLIIAPGPQVADDLRERCPNNEIITISHFLRNNLYEIIGKDQVDQNFKIKSDLMLLLWTSWKQYFPDEDVNYFRKIFSLFTELRSFSLDMNSLSSVLNDCDDLERKALMLFSMLMEELNLIDEHKAISLLASKPWSEGTYVFWGYRFLSGQQIDLLVQMGQHCEVYVPFPKRVYDESSNLDWVRWISSSSVTQIPPQKHKQNPDADTRSLGIYTYPRGRLAQALSEFKKTFKKQDELDVLLLAPNEDMNLALQVPFKDLFFKNAVDLFSSFLSELYESLESFTLGANIPTKDFLLHLEGLLKKTILQGNANPRKIKLLCLLEELVREWKDLSQINETLHPSDLEILFEILALRLPRNFHVPLLPAQSAGRIGFLELLPFAKLERSTLLCFDSIGGPLKGNGCSFVSIEKNLNALAVLAPIKRKEFEYLQIQFELRQILEGPNTYIFMEKDLLQSDDSLSRLFEPYQVLFHDALAIKSEKKNHAPADYLQRFVLLPTEEERLFLSPTKLQSYLDCPRKYYFHYLAHASPFVILERHVLEKELGTLEHLVIRRFFESEESFSDLVVEKIVGEVWEEHLRDKKHDLNDVDYRKHFIEIFNFSKNGILELSRLMKEYGGKKLVFEQTVFEDIPNGPAFKGSADVVMETHDGVCVFDFKRSKTGVPSKKDILNFAKIQVPFYVSRLPFSPTSPFGYINLSDPDEGLYLFASDLDVELYKKKESEFVARLSSESHYSARPRTEEVCRYCFLKNVCERGLHVKTE